jgi:hypothetical protein
MSCISPRLNKQLVGRSPYRSIFCKIAVVFVQGCTSGSLLWILLSTTHVWVLLLHKSHGKPPRFVSKLVSQWRYDKNASILILTIFLGLQLITGNWNCKSKTNKGELVYISPENTNHAFSFLWSFTQVYLSYFTKFVLLNWWLRELYKWAIIVKRVSAS